ncbi:MAG: cell wall metabolism sensor histidine kinase WalK [Omnitrophica bacterium]|nr:cell wall metabolism sensor histidine kinase WalK [Candidatus Omnitrophota bacterium]
MRVNFRYKIALVFTVVFLALLLGAYLSLNEFFGAYAYQEARTNLLKKASYARSFLERYLDKEELSYETDELADTLSRDLGVGVTILGRYGTVIGDSALSGEALRDTGNWLERPEILGALESEYGESNRLSATTNENMLFIASAFGEKMALGVVRLAMPVSEVTSAVGRLERLSVAALLIAFVVGVIVIFAVSFLITIPINRFFLAMKARAGDDFSQEAQVKAEGEMGDVAEAFNCVQEKMRARTEDAVTSELRLEAMLRGMFDGAMILNLKGNILFTNDSLKELLSLREKSPEKSPLEVTRNAEIQEVAEKALKLKRGVISRQISVVLPREKILLVHARPILREGNPEGAVLVFRDVTKLRRLEKIRRDLVASETSTRSRLSSLVVKDGAKSGLFKDSIGELLDLPEIDLNRLVITCAPCAIHPIVKRVLALFKTQLEKKSLDIGADLPKNLPKILADPEKLSQAFINLIDNSIKQTPSGGKITVKAEEKDNKFVVISVSDTGCGISEKNLAKLFENFYCEDKLDSPELGWTGLGLSVVKHIVEAHNGKTAVMIEPKKGSTFSFTIPKA